VYGALRRGDLAAVVATQPAQESLAAALRDAGTARLAAAGELAADLGLPPDGLTLATLAARLPEPWAAELREVRNRLSAVVAEIAAVQGRNANLIAHLRSYFRDTLIALTAAGSPVRYGPSGVRLSPAAGRAIQARG
jgi:hypothetical protein